MELDQIIAAVQDAVPGSTKEEVLDYMKSFGVDRQLYTPGHLASLINSIKQSEGAITQGAGVAVDQGSAIASQGSIESTKSKAPKSGKLAKSKSNKLADRSEVIAEAPKFEAARQEDLGLAQVEADGYAVGYGDISTVMATARRGYAQGAKEAFEEGAIESSNFRKQVLSSAVGAMFGGS